MHVICISKFLSGCESYDNEFSVKMSSIFVVFKGQFDHKNILFLFISI